MKAKWRVMVLIASLLGTEHALADSVSCLNPMLIGTCIWLVCTLYECHTEYSAHIGHFNPDVDVTVRKPKGVERTEEGKRIDTHNRNHQNLIFHDGRATGNILAGRFYCPSQATPLFPYFISELDKPAWRWGWLDMLYLAAWIPGLREIGNFPLNTWGNLYPRTGWTIQSSPPKSAAVTAQRIGDVITRTGEPHLYLPLTGEADGDNKRVWEPSGLLENTNKQGLWQLIWPVFDPSCLVFGENDTLKPVDWGGGKVARDGDYSYTLWRPYTCCEIKGEAFLGVVDWIDYPPPI